MINNIIDNPKVGYFFVGIAILMYIIAKMYYRSSKRIKKSMIKKKNEAMRPKPNRRLLRCRPKKSDIVLGKYKNKYVCWDARKDGHILVIGGSGSGKSSCLVIPMLQNCSNIPVLAIDIKPELVIKSGRKNDPKTVIFNPTDHESHGFDPFFALTEASTQQEIFETMQLISNSVIPISSTSDSFWPVSARNMATGLMVKYWNKGYHDFIEIVDALFSAPIKDQIEETVNECTPDSIEYRQLIQYYNMADETLLSIFSNLGNCFSCFTNDGDLRWAFSGAENKCSPLSLEEGKSIFLAVPEYKLAAYSKALAMIVNLSLDMLSRRPEKSHKVFVVLDEVARVISSGGAMENLVNASMTLRSRNVSLFLAVQQIESLETGFLKAQVINLVGNCSIRIILDASSSDTQRTVCSDWTPDYIFHHHSTTFGSKNSNQSCSYEYKARVVKSDLMQLVEHGELIAITPYGYMMLEKCPYYKDKYYRLLERRKNK